MKRAFIPWLTTLMVALALARLPYGYYMLLRLVLCAACIYYLGQASRLLASGHSLTLGAAAVLYNPLIPVHLGSKPLWTVINVATVLYFWFVEHRLQRTSPVK